MKRYGFYVLYLLLATGFSCSDDDTPPESNENCGPLTTTLCYAHNWQEFEMLVDFPDGKAIYNHQYFHESGLSYFNYKLKITKPCPNSTVQVELTNTVDLGSSVSYLGVMYINGKNHAIQMDNLNGIITGKMSQTVENKLGNSLIVENTIIVHHQINGKEDDINWYNENVGSHGMTVKFYPVK